MESYEVGRVRFKPFGWCEINHNHRLEDIMKSGNRDKAEGKFHEIKGKMKEKAGKLTDNPKREIEGVDEKIAGKAQGKTGEVKKALGK